MSLMEPLEEWSVSRWFNTEQPLELAKLRGHVVLVHAFQMLCQGCVVSATPQAQRAHELFRGSKLQVIGLHTVFEHHAAMTDVSLEAFLQEFRITFPVGVDRATEGPLPETMRRYALRGTPSTLLVDARGRLRRHTFGGHEDMALGAEVASLLAEAALDAELQARDEELALIQSPASAAGSCSVGGSCRSAGAGGLVALPSDHRA